MQSQLWQPLSAYPLQPQLSESNISFVEGAGPQTAGLNEYHSLFTQDGIYASLDGYGGGDGTWSEDVTGSFLAGPLAVSVGQFHFESDGWRPNSWQEQDILNGLVQWQLSPSTSFQFEASTLDWDQGDLSPHFDRQLLNLIGKTTERNNYRLGLRHKFNPRIAVIVSLAGSESDVGQNSVANAPDADVSLMSDVAADRTSVEVQAVQRFESTHLIYGLGSTLAESDLSVEYLLENRNIGSPGLTGIQLLQDKTRAMPEQISAYVYVSHDWLDVLDIEAGLGFVSLDHDYKSSLYTSFQIVDANGNVLDEVNGAPQFTDFEMDDEIWLPKLGFSSKISDLVRSLCVNLLLHQLILS
ncbi:hypothetical protein FT643_22995 [Ketobacter sp. MCCC 1A13808]|uniref:hypothetical protein n=1 Tax=Ketobacter sp. MCCC 1A13808 TaxID=2602738 RepID=UPI0012ECB514|nr:hypothetical protein [Ketobacter sp. MCCC 1A13808]MVF14995.1 hypothetical protein [Ketobacter sp. MCCC 1A13808]